MAHAFKPSNRKAEAGGSLSLVYRASFRTHRETPQKSKKKGGEEGKKERRERRKGKKEREKQTGFGPTG